MKRRWRNNIEGIVHQGSWITNPRIVKDIFATHFEQRFKQIKLSIVFGIESLSNSRITPEMALSLDKHFPEIIIKGALWNINLEKSPGPDGFNGFCIRKYCDQMKPDIIHFMEVFHKTGILPHSINSSFITLIPKVEAPFHVHEFRPISLIKCTMKILLKLLAKRLKPSLFLLVSEEQFTFVQDRYISDSNLIAGEMTHSIQQKLTKGVVLKIDFEKAFDLVCWDFLMYALQLQGFSSKWRN